MDIRRTGLVALLSVCVGAAAHAAWINGAGAGVLDPPRALSRAPKSLRHPLQARLYRFELEDGVEPTFQAWMQLLRDEHVAVIETLGREQMYVEGIFREREREPRVIYWLTVQGTGGAPVETSSAPIDLQHIAFMGKTLRKGSRSILTNESWLMAPFVERRIAEHQAEEAR